MAFAFIGESVASGIIGKIAEAAYTALQENLLPDNDIEAELERLQYALPQIKAVLSAVENGEIDNQNKPLTAWMWQFRDALEYAEDVLDEMAYYELEEKVQNQVNASASSLKRKFIKFLGGAFKIDDHGIFRKLAMVVKGLDKVVSSVHNFADLQRGSGKFHGKIAEENNVENDRETGSMITESVVIGREKERDLIVEWLTTDSSDGGVSLSAFTIYGIGGLGKTTLAQLICNDEKVTEFFGPIIWVCVSDQFDTVAIIKRILEIISIDTPMVQSLTSLQDKLKKRLMSKKFLLILDDVWNDENRLQWEKLIAPLKVGYGKILMTTRMESVANMAAKVIQGKRGDLKLNGLGEDDFFVLFKKHAFYGVDPDEFRNLLPIGKQIAKKLGGCPLAAKIMGGVLSYSIELEHWNKVLEEDVPDFYEAKDAIMIVLKLSYRHLPTYLQLCFRYCSIFPKDHIFEKDELIKMWMGSGLIEPLDKRQIPEDVGRGYFSRLVRKSFFDLKDVNYYVMHDLLHDLAQSVSEGECLRIEKCPSGILRTIRHLSFNTENLQTIREISYLKNLRTLLITFNGHPDNDDIQIFIEVIKRLKCLRLLSLISESLFEVHDAIGELIHLRYLSHESEVEIAPRFPLSICKLYHLEIINFPIELENGMEVHEANEIGNLIKLRYINVEAETLRQIPCIGKLTFLRELESFDIGPESGHMISELKNLQSLRKLAITNLDGVSNPADAKDAKLNEKQRLNSLSLSWQNEASICSSSAAHEHIADNLRPHIHLQELAIVGYGGMRYPIWMTHSFLVNLISLTLSRCYLLESLLPLGKLPLLRCLKLLQLPQLKKISQSFYGNDTEYAFPVLKELWFSNMPELEEWDEVEDMTPFPRLEMLSVCHCPKLRKLPSLPPSLKELKISDVGLEILPRIYPSNSNSIIFQTSLSNLHVTTCPNLTSLNGCVLEQHGVIQALSNLLIQNCERLACIPSRGLKDFTALKYIKIVKCPVLATGPGTQDTILPFSLQTLTIIECSLDLVLLRSVRNFTALTELLLQHCSCLSSFPLFEILATLTTLNNLDISYCSELSSLRGIEALTSLRHLTIIKCEKLTTTSLLQPPLSVNANDCNLLRLDNLLVDPASLLFLEPLRSLRFTKRLHIDDASGLTRMPEEWLLQNCRALRYIYVAGATSLEHLPSCLDKLQLLDTLAIRAPLIQSLPDLPLSMSFLSISECHHVLKERYEKDSGPEWHKIAFISDVRFS